MGSPTVVGREMLAFRIRLGIVFVKTVLLLTIVGARMGVPPTTGFFLFGSLVAPLLAFVAARVGRPSARPGHLKSGRAL